MENTCVVGHRPLNSCDWSKVLVLALQHQILQRRTSKSIFASLCSLENISLISSSHMQSTTLATQTETP